MSEHTPGPWAWEPETEVAVWDQYKELASVERRPQSIIWTRMDGAAATWIVANDADARLIAAAPDLLAACEAVEAQLLRDAEGCCPEKLERLHPLYDQVLAAIAKAKEAPNA